jgi:hypothetical protein
MNLDLTILLVLALLALVGWNIYLSLGRRENKLAVPHSQMLALILMIRKWEVIQTIM